MNNDSKHGKRNDELKPGSNTVIEPDQTNPGPTDMIEDAVGDIVDNIRKDFTREPEDDSNKD